MLQGNVKQLQGAGLAQCSLGTAAIQAWLLPSVSDLKLGEHTIHWITAVLFKINKVLAQCLLALPNKILISLVLKILLKFLLAHQVTIARQVFFISVPAFLLTVLACWSLHLTLPLTISNFQIYLMCMEHS